MSDEDEKVGYNRFQSSPDKLGHVENYEELYEEDYDNALEDPDSLKASSVTMNYSVSKTGNFEEHELPGQRYEVPIEEHPEENEDSKYNQPTQEEIDLQNQRIQKAKQALIKMKKEEAAKKVTRNNRPQTAAKLKIVQKKELPAITKKKTMENKEKNSENKEKSYEIKERRESRGKKIENKEKSVKNQEIPKKIQSFQVESSKSQGTFSFQVEKPAKATNQAPNEKISIPPIKISNSQDLKTKKIEDQAKLEEDHKANLANLRSIFDDKKKKADNDFKKMNEFQKKLLNNERNYQPPDRVPDRFKVSPPVPPAPKPKAFTQGAYKLHQLAASTGSSDVRLVADKLSGSMLQAIKILSIKTSEEFIFSEILEEEKRLEETEKLLTMGKDMKRGEVDYHEEARKKIKIYQNLIIDHKKLIDQQGELLKFQDTLLEKVKKLESIKAIVKLGDGRYMRAGMMPDNLIDTLSELESVGSEVMKENPIDQVIEKIEKQGCTLRDLFNQIDVDGDKILTITEIRNGLAGIQIKISEDDKALLLRTLDSNSDGVVSEEEFFKILDPKLQVQKEYRALIGNLDINNPIIFEEQVLDMKLRGKMLHRDIPKLATKLKSKIETEQKLLNRIKLLENALESRQIKSISNSDLKKDLELELIENQQKRDQLFQKGMQEKSSFAMNFSVLQEKIQKLNREKASVTVEAEFKKRDFVNSKVRAEAIADKEERLDKENRFIAIVIIQKKIRRYIARIRYLKEKKRVEDALQVIVPAMKKFNSRQKERKLGNQREEKENHESFQDIEKMSQDKHSDLQENVSVCSQKSYQSENGYFCTICNKNADRICRECKRNSCYSCFAECRIKRHTFSILSSERKDLNGADKEFILIFKEQGGFNLISKIFDESQGKISFLGFKSALYEENIEPFLINNVLTLSRKFVDGEDFMIDLNGLMEIFSH